MNSLLDDLDDHERGRNDREMTLSTATILGIFFGLVLLCGVFFGFGYKLGSHKAASHMVVATAAEPSNPSSTFSDFKPAAGSPEGGSAALPSSSRASVSDATETASDSSEDVRDRAKSEAAAAREDAKASNRAASTTAADTTLDASAAGDIFVQVAAVSHPEDAKLLVNALRAKGYPVSAHTQAQDKFFHIQVGPFDSLQDAQAAKQRLLADGYQPIIK